MKIFNVRAQVLDIFEHTDISHVLSIYCAPFLSPLLLLLVPFLHLSLVSCLHVDTALHVAHCCCCLVSGSCLILVVVVLVAVALLTELGIQLSSVDDSGHHKRNDKSDARQHRSSQGQLSFEHWHWPKSWACGHERNSLNETVTSICLNCHRSTYY